ncbi:transketolase [Hydrogenispora ethanolica]|uniref:Transketolase n=1 Tax=Hydrogenispora ethanolica TaxID=1082276 RepID=A0A4R1QZ76_HYDET|nr:transketolase [Hydrogenispora ethanolica]TCL58292.1 transketolase [Hydrogenispora ethanolica]
MIHLVANTIRGLAADMVENAKSGHPGMPLGTADIAAVLYGEILNHHPTVPDWPNRDRFVLSAGHGSALLYSVLHLSGYDLSLEDLKQFRKLGSKTPGHPEFWHVPGVETTTGPLGQGIANAVGMALAERILAERFNQPGFEVMNHYTYAIAGDGCMMEGISSEASSLAGDLGLGKLIVIYDDNSISIEGSTEIAFNENVAERYLAYGWQVLKIDGHQPDEIRAAFEAAKADRERPTLIIAKTVIGKGSPRENDPEAHGTPLGKDNVYTLKRTLGLPEQDFYVPEEVNCYFTEQRMLWQRNYTAWEEKFAAWSERFPELRREWDRVMRRELPDDLESILPHYEVGTAFATRDCGGKILNALAAKIPELIGGSADLAPSTKTYIQGASDIKKGEYYGKNLHFGVREHGMAGILNGLSLHGGLRVYGSTFLVFVDYMRHSLRLASLMREPVIYVLTHDSFYVGEDGPTHQPVEQLQSLRIIPGFEAIRPADANETAWAWLHALKRTSGPTALILTRQKLPTLAGTSGDGFQHGAYILREATHNQPDLIILASGSEVSLAVAVADTLSQTDKAVRVVSVPCLELFLAQEASYIQAILGEDVPRVALEAGVSSGWYQLTGINGLVIGMDHFGKSGPAEQLAEEFGFTPEKVTQQIKTFFNW